MTLATEPEAPGSASDRSPPFAAPGRPRRRRRVALSAAIGVFLIAVGLIAVLATRPAATQTVVSSPLIGRAAPPITGTDLAGTRVSLAALRGRYVLVNFYASWCPPCQTEAPQLETFAYSHPAGQRVAVLGVVFSDSASNARAFEHEVGATWPSVADPGGHLAIAYGVDDPPQSFLVAPNGRVVARILGGVTAAGLDELVSDEQFSARAGQA